MAGVLELFARRAARGRPDISGVAACVLHDVNLLQLILSFMPEIAIRSLHHHCLAKRRSGAIEHLIAGMAPDRIVAPWHRGQLSVAEAVRLLESHMACGRTLTLARRVYEHHARPGVRVTRDILKMHELLNRAEHPWVCPKMLMPYAHAPVVDSILEAIEARRPTIVVDGPPGSAKTAIILSLLRSSSIPARAVTFSAALAKSTSAEWSRHGYSMQTSNSIAFRDYKSRISQGSAKWGSPGGFVEPDVYFQHVMHYLDLPHPPDFMHADDPPPVASDVYHLADPGSTFPYYTHWVCEKWTQWFPVDRGRELLIVDEYQDASSATRAVAAAYRNGTVVYLGDPNQRLSESPLPQHNGALRLAMSHTFRFGPDVAAMCNALIEQCPLMFGFGEHLREPPVVSGTLRFPSPLEDVAVIGFANRDVFHISETIVKYQKTRKVEFLSRRLKDMRAKHMAGHRGSGRILTAGTIHSVKGMTFRDRTVVVQRGRIRSDESKRRYLVSLSRVQSGGRSKLVVYDDPDPTTNAGESDIEDEWVF